MVTCIIFIGKKKAPENMYMYEGQDYSRASDKDRHTFDQLLAGLTAFLQIPLALYLCALNFHRGTDSKWRHFGWKSSQERN